MAITITDIYRYPVKGLSGERLERIPVEAEQALPDDRRFALAHGASKFNPSDPVWVPKSNFFMLAKDEKLAQLGIDYDAESEILSILRNGKQVSRGKITDPVGRTLLEQFLSSFLADSGRGTPKIVEAPGGTLMDASDKVVSILNLESVKDLERVTRTPVDPRRFRTNFWIEGAAAWQEFDWVGREFSLGGVRLKAVEAIERCAATNVNPDTAERDMNIPLTLRRGFDHICMGIYAQILSDGEIAVGDALDAPAGDEVRSLPL
ncbi:MAG: MOSC domain-containing protein [Rhodovibrionaceae bacterium]